MTSYPYSVYTEACCLFEAIQICSFPTCNHGRACVCVQHSFTVGQDSGRCVACMVSYGQGVWVALQGSAQVRLYHSTSYESIAEVDVAPAVHKMLAGTKRMRIGLY